MQPDGRYATAMAQMRENCARDVPWFVGANIGKGKEFVIVAGGPSMRTRLASIKRRQKAGACVLACNGAAKFLLANGIKPDICAFLDISPVVTGFIPDPDPGCHYMVSSTVHGSVLDALEGRKVVMFHCDYGEGRNKDQIAILEEFPDKPGSLIGGGNTIGMRAPHLGYLLGFRSIHFYGMDSSYADDGADHAYVKHDGVEPDTITAKYGEKEYRCSPWMVRQAGEFEFYYRQFAGMGCQFHVHGTGLLPDIYRALVAEKRMAA
jgi:hypothetical protein